MGHKRLIFNGISSDELNLVIQSDPVYNYPEKDVTSTHVPGRNGDILIDTGSYKNVARSYSLGVGFKNGTTFIDNSEKIIQWLKTAEGYSRLEDDYDPKVYRLARYSASGSLTNMYDEATTISVQFECQPQRFLKEGEIEKTISVPTGKITNPTKYDALPMISFENIPSDAGNIMITFTNDKYSNIVTINSIVNSKLVIDSETQEVYDPDTEESLSKMVNINDGTFPVLKGGETVVKTQLFSDTVTDIPSYKKVIEKNQKVLDIKYEPYQTALDTKQQKIVIPSINARKISIQESYYARAYSALALEKAEEYTFVSFNSIVSQQAKSLTFVAGEDNVSDLVDWLSSTENEGTYTFSLSPTNSGWIFMNGLTKWTYYAKGSSFLTNIKKGSVVTIQYLPEGADGQIDIAGYSDKPEWVDVQINFNSDRSIANICYVANKNGYYYIQKTGLTTRAQWIEVKEGGNYQLNKVSWSSWKKAFISYEGLSSSTTATYTYRYLNENPQYDDVVEEKTDSNGTIKKEVTSKVHFRVEGTVVSPVFKVLDDGWYRCNNSGFKDSDNTSTHTSWQYLTKGSNMPVGFNESSTEANNIYYIKDETKVNYAGVSSWPNWLDTIPYAVDGKNILNSQSIKFKVTKDGYYRYSEIVTDSQGSETENMTEFKMIHSGDFIETNTKPNKSQTVCEVDALPTDWSEQFNLTFNDGLAENIPDWCTFVWFPIDGDAMEWDHVTKKFVKSERTKQSKEESDVATYEILAKTIGVYRLDENIAWVSHAVDDLISSSRYLDDTKVRFLNETPHHSENNYFTDEVSSDATGNFTAVSIIAKQSGYYRLGTNTSWTKYSVGDTIASFDTDESNTLMFMTPVDMTGNITIKIKPNWWML